jgi:hypothetical protein
MFGLENLARTAPLGDANRTSDAILALTGLDLARRPPHVAGWSQAPLEGGLRLCLRLPLTALGLKPRGSPRPRERRDDHDEREPEQAEDEAHAAGVISTIFPFSSPGLSNSS